MSQPKATPREWRKFERGNIGPNWEREIWIGIDDPEWGELTVATIRAGCDEAVEVLGPIDLIADKIIRAVNHHEELVAALEDAEHWLGQAWACIEHIKEKSPDYERKAAIEVLKELTMVGLNAKSALAKARVKGGGDE